LFSAHSRDKLPNLRAEPISSHAIKALRYRWPLSLKTRLLITAVAIVIFTVAWFICQRDHKAHLEHGALENIQAAALVSAAIILALAAAKTSGSRRVFVLGLSLFCFVFLMLEFDTRAFNSPLLRRLTNGTPRNLWLGTVVALYAFAFWRRRFEMPPLFVRWLSDRAGLLMLIAGGFWIAGAIFEHGPIFSDPETKLILEEVIEVDAALFMAWSALATVKLFSARDAAASKPAALP
jgi:hypothetical protein